MTIISSISTFKRVLNIKLTMLSSKFRGCTWNINNGVISLSPPGANPEQCSRMDWNNRWRKVSKSIIKKFQSGMNFVCVQEIRNMDKFYRSKNVEPVPCPPKEFLDNIRLACKEAGINVDYVLEYRNSSDLPFGQATFFDLSKIKLINAERIALSWGHEGKFQYSRFGDSIATVTDFDLNGEKISIANCHFPMGEDSKMMGVNNIKAFAQQKTSEGFYVIVVGDFNFFMDKNGPEQLKSMLEYFDDHSENLTTIDKEIIDGSFISYIGDSFYQTNLRKIPHLDRVFTPRNGPKLSVCVDVTSAKLDKIQEDHSLYASDHLGLNFEWGN